MDKSQLGAVVFWVVGMLLLIAVGYGVIRSCNINHQDLRCAEQCGEAGYPASRLMEGVCQCLSIGETISAEELNAEN